MADSWVAYLNRLPSGHPVRKAIFHYWQRSSEAGVPRTGDPKFRRVPPAELEQRLAGTQAFVEAAKRHVDAFLARLPGSTNVAYVTDRDGIVLYSAGDPAQIEQFGLAPGYDWSERAMGTNGAGTCLVVEKPVIVKGAEHYQTAFENCTCTAAPVYGRDGTLLGALDVSSSVEEGNIRRIADVVTVAKAIERDIARQPPLLYRCRRPRGRQSPLWDTSLPLLCVAKRTHRGADHVLRRRPAQQ